MTWNKGSVSAAHQIRYLAYIIYHHLPWHSRMTQLGIMESNKHAHTAVLIQIAECLPMGYGYQVHVVELFFYNSYCARK